MPEELVVETEGLTKRFGARVALDGVDLSVPAGVAFGFLGPNGAGKTTLIRTLLGLTRASAGSMKLLGLPVPEQRARALQRVGAIVEEPRFHPHLTGRQNLQIIAAARDEAARGRVDGALRRVGLADRADDKVKGYSLGMRQRLGVARCLIADPHLLILDEPTNGLDPAGIQEFRAMIRGLVVEEGRTVFLSSHLLDEVEKTCDAAAIVDQGRVLVQGTMDQLKGTGTGANEVIVGVDDLDAAQRALADDPRVGALNEADGALRVTFAGDPAFAAELNRILVQAGVAVYRLEPVRQSLEQRFLEITSRLEAVPA
ncbi:MAG TPA: ABC transporter ATP-binding protein [Solirubrobacteraceae bacterium]|nr:ABC transporter ATP-binding protein [Solirubrobacteraceae bacterium]